MKTNGKTSGKRISLSLGKAAKTGRPHSQTKRVEDLFATDRDPLQNIFDTLPVSVWVEDFSKVKVALDKLKAQGVTDFRTYFTEHPEFVKKAIRNVRVVDVNAMTLKLYEAGEKSEFAGSLGKIFLPESLNGFYDELIAIAEGKAFFEGETTGQTLRGKKLILWKTIVFPGENSTFDHVLIALTDITGHKRTELALRESEARLLTVLEGSPLPMMLNSVEQGVLLYGNTALADFLGLPLLELIGQTAIDFYADPGDRTRALAELERTGALRDYEVRLRRSDGSAKWVSLSVEQMLIDGQVCHLSCFYDITQRKYAEALQIAIYEISEAANKSASLDELYRSVHSIIGQVMPAQNFYIAIYDAAKNLLGFPYYVDEVDGSASIPPTTPGRGMTEYILRTGKPLLSDSSNFEELAHRGEVELVGPASPIWVGAPLVVDDRTIGVIALQDYHNPHAYTERELRMLEYVSSQVAKAIERTRLYADIRLNNRILSALQVATLSLIKQTELSEVLQEILKQASGLFDTTDGYIYLTKSDDSELVMSMGVGPSSKYIGTRLQKGEGLAGKVWQSGNALTVEDYEQWSGHSTQFENATFHATAAVPLISRAKVIGVLGIGYIEPDRKFDSVDLDFLTRFAELASIAIENSRLYTLSQQELAERKIAEEALRKTEEKYRALVEHSPAITYTALMDDQKTRLYVSPQIETLLGYTPAEYLADSGLWRKIIHPDDTERVLEETRKFYQSGEPFISEYRSRARDGRYLWFHDEAIIHEENSTGRRFIQGLKVDITQRMQVEALQIAIYQISDAASASSSMDELYAAIHRALQTVMTADNFFIALYDKETDLLSFPYYVDQRDPTPATAPLGQGLTAYVIRKGVALLGRPDAIQKLEDMGEVVTTGTRSIDWLGVPLKIQNETFGAMVAQTYMEGIRYGQRELDILSFVSTQVALSIERKRTGENLRAAEAQYRTLVEQLPVVIYVSPADNICSTTYISPQINDFLGYTQEEWLTDINIWKRTLHPEDRQRILDKFERADKFGEPPNIEYRMIAKNGAIVWISEQATLLQDVGGRPLLWQGLMTDVTERRLAEERITRQIDRLNALRTIDLFIASGTDLHLTLQTILHQAVSQLRIDAADILLLNTSMHTLEFAEGTGFHTRSIEQSSVRVGDGYAGKAALEREMVVMKDLSEVKGPLARHTLLIDEGFVSYYGVPLIAKGEVKGVLEIFLRSHQEVNPEWMDFLESLAGQAALAIDNASLFDSLQRSNLELGMAYETTLEGWSAALDLRDRETEGHTRRVTDLTLKLAESMGLSERERVHIRRGALLHDIGKMGIPDRILLKPDTLNDEEWEIMRQHPTYAFNLLLPIAHLRPALDIPYCHHERWDGTGYPRRLKGESIPLAARIFAVADVWDALLSDRPYRLAWTREKALEHIKSLSGTHFDPNVVQAFLQVVGGVIVPPPTR